MFFQLTSFAQTPASLGIGRFAGLSAGGLNPSFLALNPLSWDIQLGGGSVLFTNSTLSLDATSLSSLLNGVKIDVLNESSILKQVTADRFFRENLNGDNQYLYGQFTGSGLGLMFSIGPRLTFGLSNHVHGVISTTDLPEVTLRHAFEGINYSKYLDSTLTVRDINFSGALWSETNLQASWMFVRNKEWMASAGIGLKWLNALGGFRTNIAELSYEVPREDTVLIKNLNMSYASSIPGPLNGSSLFKSTSLGFDLGISVAYIDEERSRTKTIRKVKRGSTDCYSFRQVFKRYKKKDIRPDYRWKAGFAVLDIGSLSINEDVRGYNVSNARFGYKNGEKIFGDRINTLDSVFLAKFQENGTVTPINNLDLTLNTRVSVQFDYRISNFGGIGFSWIHRLNNSPNSIKRINHLALIPRLEWTFLELAFPINLYEYRETGVGLMLRLGPLTVGTDRLSEILGMKNIYGADAYFSLRVFDMF